MEARPAKCSKVVDRRPWTAFTAEPSLHEGEESWHYDKLIVIDGENFPPRFRIALTCSISDTTVCVPVEIYEGAFTIPEGLQVTPSACVAAHGQAIQNVLTGRFPPLARMIAWVPESIRLDTDGSWDWDMTAWGWDPELNLKRSDFPGEDLRKRFDRHSQRQKRRLTEIKRRMGVEWQSEVLPRLRELASYMEIRNLSRTQLVKEIQAKGWSRSQTYQDLRTATELGMIGAEPGTNHAESLDSSRRTTLQVEGSPERPF